MELTTISAKIFVTVVPTGKLKKVPLDFPWLNRVSCSIYGDLSDLDNVTKELGEIKSCVNQDISRFKMNLKDFRIKIEFLA